LERALSDLYEFVREAAAEALGAVGDRAAGGPLERALRDPKDDVRLAAAKALGMLGDRAARGPLEQALLKDSDGGAVLPQPKH
jgi:HEAT repeat protein